MKLNSLIASALCLLIYSCSGNVPETDGNNTVQNKIVQLAQKILPPLKGVAVGAVSYSFDNSKGSCKKTQKGSIVIVPENAFVDENGEPVQGEVNVEIEEYTNPAEIILSGIPMDAVDANGEVVPFVSDGMFKLTASSDGKPLEIAKDKTVKVSMVQNKSSEEFDYWFFDEEKGSWGNLGDRDTLYTEESVLAEAKTMNEEATNQYLASLNTTPSTVTKYRENQDIPLELKAPVKPTKYKEGDFVFTLQSDYKNNPELLNFKNVMWKPVEKLDKASELQISKALSSRGANIQVFNDPLNQSVYSIQSTEMTVKATPVLMGKDYEKAQAKFNEYRKEYEANQNALKAQAKKAAVQSNFYSLFSLSRTGVYNCDKFYNTKLTKSNVKFRVAAEYVTDGALYVVLNEDAVIRLSSGYLSNSPKAFSLPLREVAGAMYINENSECYYAKKENLVIEDENDSRFVLQEYPHEIQDVTDLNILMNEIR